MSDYLGARRPPSKPERTKDTMNFSDLKAKVEQLSQSDAARKATEKAGSLAHEHRGTVTSWVDKAGRVVDEKTHGKYHGSIGKVQTGVATGIDKIAGQQPGPGTNPGAPTPPPAG